MCAILRAGELDHTIDARESSASTTISVWVELLLGEDVTTRLQVIEKLLDLTEEVIVWQ
jgi:hypothetical protein